MDTIDRATLGRAQQGDLKARTMIVRLHHRRVRTFIATMCGDPNAVDDLAQEVFLRALDRLDRVIETEKLGAFLRGMARNVVHEHHRSLGRDTKRLTVLREHAEDWLDRGESSDWISDDVELVKAMEICLGTLPERSREMIRLRYLDESNATEIANLFKMQGNTVRSALRRIRNHLWQCIFEKHGTLPHLETNPSFTGGQEQ